jgi:uncharacterized phiE125 gp8 family phage protein
MKLKLLSKQAPNIALDDVKNYLRVITTDEDNLITAMINAAVDKAEAITNRALSVRSYELYLDKAEVITNRALSVRSYELYLGKVQSFEIPKPPFTSLTSIEVKNGDNYVAFDGYLLDDKSEPAKVIINNYFAVDCYKNAIYKNAINCLKVTYSCGYSEIPEQIKIWIYSAVATMYENREQISDFQSFEMPNRFIDSLLDPYKVRFFG